MSGSPSSVLRLLVNGPVGASISSLDAPEGIRRAAEWERQIETLDQKEMELHQTHLKLLREQTQTFIRDLSTLRQEVVGLRQWQERVTTELAGDLEGRHRELLSAWEKDARDRDIAHQKLSADVDRKLAAHKKSTEDIAYQHADSLSRVHDAMGKLDYHHGSVNERLDNLAKDVEILVANRMSAVDAQIRELRATLGGESKVSQRDLQAHHASVSERIVYLEKLLGDSADKHARDMEGAHKKMEMLHGKLSEHHSKLASHASLEDRMNYVEKLLGDSIDKHSKEIAAAHARIQDVHGKVGDLNKDRSAKDQHHASIQERLDFIEGMLGNSADKNSAELSMLKAAHDKHIAALTKHGRDMEALKRLMDETHDKHTRELLSAGAKLDQMHGRMSACEKLGGSLDDLKRAHGDLSKSKSDMLAHHASTQERLQYLEGVVGDSADKHAAELARLKASHDKHAETMSKHAKDLEAIRGMSSQHSVLEVHHASLAKRVDYLEKALGESAEKHQKDLEAAHKKMDMLHGKVSEQQSKMMHHATVEERINYVEKMLGDSADKHARELAAAHSKIAEMHGKVGELHKDKASKDQSHASIQERMQYLEGVVGDSADKHAAELARLKAAHDKHADAMVKSAKDLDSVKAIHAQHATLEVHHATLAKRVDYLEKVIGDSADRHQKELEAAHGQHLSALTKHARDLEALKRLVDETHDKHARELLATAAKMDQMHGRMSACEKFSGSIDELRRAHGELAKNRNDLLTHHASTQERLQYLEAVLGDSADKHAAELARLKAAHDKHAKDLEAVKGAHAQTLEVHHATLAKRVDYLEKVVGESADKHQRELEVAHKKMDLLHGKLSETQSSMVKHASIEDRLNYVEQSIGDSADKHARELAAAHAKIAEVHGKVGDLHKDKATKEQSHASLQDRMQYLEGLMGDSADKHSAELARLKAAHDKHAESVSKHAKDLDAVKAVHAAHATLEVHHASLAKRVDYLEKALGESADKHQKDLEMAHKKMDLLHGKVTEQQSRMVHHASVEERLNYLEKSLGDSADKHARELAAAHAKIAEVHGKVGDLSKDKAQKEQHHASLQERLGYVERMLGDSADRHAAELSALKAAHDKHAAAMSKHAKDLELVQGASASHGTVAERLAYLEKQVSAATGKHSDELASLKLAHEQLHGRLSSSEVQVASLSKQHSGLATEKKALSASFGGLKDRLDQLEVGHGDAAHRHAAELESLRGAHEKHAGAAAKLARDLDALKAAHAHHATMGERIAYLEKLMGDSADKHNQELASAAAKLEQLHGRMSACERVHGSVDELKRSHSELSKQKNDLLAHHASIQERLNYLEGIIGDSADQHAAEIARLKAAHDKHLEAFSKHAKDMDVLKGSHCRLATVEDVQQVHQKVDAMNARMQVVKGAWGQDTPQLTGRRL